LSSVITISPSRRAGISRSPVSRSARITLRTAAIGLLGGHRPLLQRAIEAGVQLALVEGLASAVVLDDVWQLELGRLEGRKALAAGRTLAPPAHRGAVVGQPRVDHPGVGVLAEGAVHSGQGNR
jgi:hypothetical protein